MRSLFVGRKNKFITTLIIVANIIISSGWSVIREVSSSSMVHMELYFLCIYVEMEVSLRSLEQMPFYIAMLLNA